MIGVLIELLAGNAQNANVFRDCGGTKSLLSLCNVEESRAGALSLLQQVILSGGNEEDMTSMLELLHAFPDYEIKTEILHTAICCLRESHKSRTIFR